MTHARDLPELLDTLDPDAELVERHLWLVALVAWLRGDSRSVGATLSRLELLLDLMEARPDRRAQFQAWWRALLKSMDGTSLLADLGFSSRSAFVREFAEPRRHKLLPATPETPDAAALFSLAFSEAFDARWLAALPERSLERLGQLLSSESSGRADEMGAGLTAWRVMLLEAITFCTSQVRATGFAPELRQRMSETALQAGPFPSLARDVENLRQAVFPLSRRNQAMSARPRSTNRGNGRRLAAAQLPRSTRIWMRTASQSTWCFTCASCASASCACATCSTACCPPNRHKPPQRLMAHLVIVGQERRSLRALFAANASLLAAKVAERSAETGEH